jgi:hypothetical protein
MIPILAVFAAILCPIYLFLFIASYRRFFRRLKARRLKDFDPGSDYDEPILG